MDDQADRDLVRVATMYYKEDMKQSDIAKQLGISRQLVSKYLVDARNKGIVDIHINSSSAYSVQLELKLQKTFGLKRAAVLDTSYLQPQEIEQLIVRNLDKISKVYKGKNGFAFSALSPEAELFLVTSDLLTDLSSLTEIDKSEIELEEDKTFKGLSDFEIIAMDLNVADQSIIEFYESVFGLKAINNQIEFPFVTLTFSVEESEDLAAGTDEVLDLEFLVFMIDKDFDLKDFAHQFSDVDGTYLDGSAKTFSLEVPDHVELWFVK